MNIGERIVKALLLMAFGAGLCYVAMRSHEDLTVFVPPGSTISTEMVDRHGHPYTILGSIPMREVKP